MASTVFTDYSTPIVASWLNPVNNVVYGGLGYTDAGPFTTTQTLINLGLTSNGSATLGAGSVGYNGSLAYATGTVGYGLNQLVLSGTPVQTSIAGLRTQLKTGPANCMVTGYYASGDGGGGLYYYDAADTTSADNGGTIIVAADGGRWKYVGTFVTIKTFGAKMDNATDDTSAINAAASWARANGNAIHIPQSLNPSIVSNTLDFSGIAVYAYGRQLPHIKCTSAQVNVIKTTGDTLLIGLYVHGGWDGVTAGQTGDILSIVAVSPAFPYRVHLRDCVFQYAKQRHINWDRAGYSSAWNVKCNAAGLRSLDITGYTSANSATTVHIAGNCIFSDTPNGPGVQITEAVSISLDGVIIENSGPTGNVTSILLAGADNRSLSFRNVYTENAAASYKHIDPGTSAGIGLTVAHNFGGVGGYIPYPANWTEVYYQGNGALGESAVPLPNRVLSANPASVSTSVVNGVDLTLASLSLPPGTFDIFFAVQTLNSAGATFVRAGCRLTTNAADSGMPNGVNPMIFQADEANYTPSNGSADVRLQGVWIGYQNTGTTNQTVYLRCYANISAGTLALQGAIFARKMS